MSFVDRVISQAMGRAPDFQIGGAENPYCNRWWIIPRNRWFNIYLHQFVRDDEDRALHDHPWLNCSIPLRAGYRDVGLSNAKIRRPGWITIRRPSTPHRVQLLRDTNDNPIEAWSLFLTGPWVRQWGFRCPQGWRHWREFTAGEHDEIVGRGCE